MRLLAKVKDDSPLHPIRCGGEEYVRWEWRPVPAGREGEAQVNPYLITETEPEPAAEILTAETADPPAEPVTIDRSDGISAPEASTAGQALAQRAHEKAAEPAPVTAAAKRAAKAAAKKGKG